MLLFHLPSAASFWLVLLAAVIVTAQENGTPTSADVPIDEVLMPDAWPNLKSRTMGGKQFWTDHAWRRGWRIQHHAVTGHWRLIDGDNRRHAWGSRDSCEQQLIKLVPDSSLACKHVVVLLHGLMRSSGSMSRLARALQGTTQNLSPGGTGDETGTNPAANHWPPTPDDKCHKYVTILFEYASTRASIGDHARALQEVIAGLPPDVDFSFVGHSMGNIVLRYAIGDWQRAGDQTTLDRMRNVVMLGPPNQGASIAQQLSKLGVFQWIVGAGGMELGPQWTELQAKLATPTCPFGIIAGKLPEHTPRNPLLEGDGDFVVGVDETRLEGAADFLVVPRLHSLLMDDTVVQQAVIDFLDHQTFAPSSEHSPAP